MEESVRKTPSSSSLSPANETQPGDYLTDINSIIIKANCESRPNEYYIFDKISGKQLYQVNEEPLSCTRFCGGNRPFKLKFVDKFDHESVLIQRESITCDCAVLCGLLSWCDAINISSAQTFNGDEYKWKNIGRVTQSWFPLFPYFRLSNPRGEEGFNIRGPLFKSGCFKGANYPINTIRGETVGDIRREWPGFCTPFAKDNPIYSINFPFDADETTKILIISAVFLLEFKYFETCCNQLVMI